MPDPQTNIIAKMPPQNIEAEQSLLGALLIDKDAIIKIADLVKADDFYQEANALIFAAILELFEKRDEISNPSRRNGNGEDVYDRERHPKHPKANARHRA